MKVFIPNMITKSENDFTGKKWYSRYKDKKRWLKALNVMIGRSVPAEKKVTLRIESLRIRKLDVDNLYGGCKGLIDCFKTLGWIKDDSPKNIDLEITQRIVRRSEIGTWIEII